MACWMKAAGLTVETDAAGNVFGRLAGKDDSQSVASGSHVDTVPAGGNFDGVLGVLAALEVAEAWKETGYVPDNPMRLLSFRMKKVHVSQAAYSAAVPIWVSLMMN
ncbi:M28 family peptidase [Jeotgalicoccus sp. WY2]|uniref:M28 family peptidase n=1 Tax=Jeotgalicoccus sp. WY2 TaxID=2708346 RepID=UPI0035302F98